MSVVSVFQGELSWSSMLLMARDPQILVFGECCSQFLPGRSSEYLPRHTGSDRARPIPLPISRLMLRRDRRRRLIAGSGRGDDGMRSMRCSGAGNASPLGGGNSASRASASGSRPMLTGRRRRVGTGAIRIAGRQVRSIRTTAIQRAQPTTLSLTPSGQTMS